MFKLLRKRIGLKFAVLILIIFSLTFATTMIFNVVKYTSIVKETVITSMETQAKNNSEILTEKLNVYKAKLTEIAMNNVVTSMIWDDQKIVLEKEVKVNDFMKMGVSDLAGKIVYTNGTTTEISKREYFTSALSGNVFVSDPLMSTAENKLVVVFSAPIKDNSDKVVGVLTATVEGQFLSTLCEGISIGGLGNGFILNSIGTTIGDIDETRVAEGFNTITKAEEDGAYSSLTNIENEMIKGSVGSGTYINPENKTTYYLSYANISGTTWSLGVTASEAELLNETKTLKNIAIIIFVVFAIVIFLIFLFFVRKMISKPLKEMVVAADYLADGDFTYRIPAKYLKSSDEIGKLASSFMNISKNLNATIQNINTTSEQVADGSRQLSDVSIGLSQGATEQASTLEQLTASIEQLSSHTLINAENAENANKYAEEAKNNAATGNNQMQNMLQAMDDMNSSSNDISRIIKVIDNIAFQTNILALNAAVEAARAGQYGKGFAVVAEEVRSLAAKSAEAAKETTNLIETSINKVDGGTKIAKETAEELERIVEGISKVAELVNNISIASKDQLLGINQINQGISQVSNVVQTNSASAQESAAASEELSSQAALLRELISKFETTEETI